MIVLIFLLSQPFDLEVLYNTATTLLVQFQNEQKISFDSLIVLGQDSVYAETTLAYLVDQFDTKSAIERHRLKDIFKAIGPSAIPAITERIEERGEDGENRRLKQSLWVLGEIGGDSIVQPVGHFIGDTSWHIRSSAFTALGKSQAAAARDFIVKGLSDSIAPVRKSAYYALSEIATEQDLARFMQGINDPYYGVRYSALHGLMQLDTLAYESLAENVHTSAYKSFFGIYGLCSVMSSSQVCCEIVQKGPGHVRFIVYSLSKDVEMLQKYLEQEGDQLLRNCILRRIGELEDDVNK